MQQCMSMMTSQILKFVDFTKTKKCRYLENETLFFLQIKKSLITHQGLLYGKNTFVAEVIVKLFNININININNKCHFVTYM